MTAAQELAVFVISSTASVRANLGQLLEASGFPTRSFESIREFFQTVTSDEAGCVLVDWPAGNARGPEFCRALRRRGYSLPVVALLDRPDVAGAVAAMKAGAFDVIELGLIGEAKDAVQAALEEGNRLRTSTLESRLARRGLERLSFQQREFLRLLMAGKEIAEIAAAMRLSQRRVEAGRTQLMRDLNVSNLIELVELVQLAGGRSDR